MAWSVYLNISEIEDRASSDYLGRLTSAFNRRAEEIGALEIGTGILRKEIAVRDTLQRGEDIIAQKTYTPNSLSDMKVLLARFNSKEQAQNMVGYGTVLERLIYEMKDSFSASMAFETIEETVPKPS